MRWKWSVRCLASWFFKGWLLDAWISRWQRWCLLTSRRLVENHHDQALVTGIELSFCTMIFLTDGFNFKSKCFLLNNLNNVVFSLGEDICVNFPACFSSVTCNTLVFYDEGLQVSCCSHKCSSEWNSFKRKSY